MAICINRHRLEKLFFRNRPIIQRHRLYKRDRLTRVFRPMRSELSFLDMSVTCLQKRHFDKDRSHQSTPIVSTGQGSTQTEWDQWTRSSPQWWSGRTTIAHIVLDLHSLIWGFGKSCIRWFMASLHSQIMCSRICNIDIFVDLWDVGVWHIPIRYPAHGFLLAPHWHIWPPISYHFE